MNWSLTYILGLFQITIKTIRDIAYMIKQLFLFLNIFNNLLYFSVVNIMFNRSSIL